MKGKVHSQLIADIDALRASVEPLAASTILGTAAMFIRKHMTRDNDSAELMAPARQSFFMLELAFSTSEPASPETTDEKIVESLVDSLNSIFNAYALMYFPEKDEVGHLPDEWHDCRSVIMPYFLTYFTQSTLASVEQVERRIARYSEPFSAMVEAEIGLTPTGLLGGASAIHAALQERLDESVSSMSAMKAIWEKWRVGASTAKLPSEASPAAIELKDSIDRTFVFDQPEIERSLGKEGAEKFLSLFLTSRRADKNFVYPTEKFSVDRRPLFVDEKERLQCPSLNALHLAILEKVEETIIQSKERESYLLHRDNTLELEVIEQFGRIVGDDAVIAHGGCETADGQYEHDVVIKSDRNLYLVEAKASPPREPFRDPERALPRVRDHFRSDSGPQKGFEQAERLRTIIASGESIKLFEGSGKLVFECAPSEVDHVFAVCMTRDSYGPLATSLNLLLQKDDQVPYPWITDIYSFESLIDGFTHLKMDENELVQFLLQRSQLHGKAFGADELEFAGFYVRHGSFTPLLEESASFIQLNPAYSDIFDEVYEADKTGQKVKRSIEPPVMTNPFGDAIFTSSKIEEVSSKKEKRKRRNRTVKQRRKMQALSKRKNRHKR